MSGQDFRDKFPEEVSCELGHNTFIKHVCLSSIRNKIEEFWVTI